MSINQERETGKVMSDSVLRVSHAFGQQQSNRLTSEERSSVDARRQRISVLRAGHPVGDTPGGGKWMFGSHAESRSSYVHAFPPCG